VKYALVTFGCRVNQADSFEFEDSLRAGGAQPAPPEEADLVVVNTCSVTGAADQSARRLVRRIARENSGARIVVTGCYATRQPDDFVRLPHVAQVVPNDQKPQLVQLLRVAPAAFSADEAWGRGAITVPVGTEYSPRPPYSGVGGCGTEIAPGAMGRTAVPLRVQTGCEETCAYCVIPSTRGASRSLPVDEVCRRVAVLASAGYKEIWLVGVHLGSFGRDLPDRPSLLALLQALDAGPGDVTFRISSLEPMDCSREMVEFVAASGRFLPHLHLPLQHGSDRILARMRRPYTMGYYEELAGAIRSAMPHAALGTDLLVGFPGERDEDADACTRRVAALPLTHLHVFPYSDRPGTDASGYPDKVEPRVMRARADALRAIGRRAADAFVRSQIGTARPGLTLEDGTLVLTDNFLKVRIPPGLARNTRVRVRLDATQPELIGHIV